VIRQINFKPKCLTKPISQEPLLLDPMSRLTPRAFMLTHLGWALRRTLRYLEARPSWGTRPHWERHLPFRASQRRTCLETRLPFDAVVCSRPFPDAIDNVDIANVVPATDAFYLMLGDVRRRSCSGGRYGGEFSVKTCVILICIKIQVHWYTPGRM
jgi:hypothetical protein